MKSIELEMKWAILGVVVVITIVVLCAWFQTYNEARTFNKFSDKKATAWDAAWADLRIEACRNN